MRSDDVIRKGLRELSAGLASGELTSIEITDAFLARIDEVQRGAKPYAIPLPQVARALAKESDFRRKKGQARGPLDGVPLSIKESVDIAGQPSTLGMTSRKGHTADRDGVVVALLREAGAVFLGKTNLSQALLFVESRNPVYGQTANPFHPERSPGGSSGGEGAAIALFASPGGIGTDIGGSIRVPCAWDGICGLKPTNDRWSNLGSSTAIAGQELVRGQIGPMARTVDDVAMLLEVVTPERCARRDPRTAPLPLPSYRDVDVKKLRVGWFVEDGIVHPSPAVERGVRRAADALEKAGARVSHYTPFLVEDAIFTYLAGLSADGAETLRAQIDEKDLDVSLKDLWRIAKLPNAARKIAGKAIAFAGEKHVGHLLEVLGEKTVAEVWQLTKRAREIAAETLSTWDRLELDIVLCPAHATPAIQHEAARDFTLAGSPSMFWNLVNFPAGVVPVTTVRADEARARPRGLLTGRLEKRASSVDEGSAGLPIGVQVVARPFREENALAAMAAIEASVTSDEGFPRIVLGR